MRFRSIWSEALRNIATGTTHAGLLALTCGLVALALAGVDLAAVTALQRQADVFHASGASVQVLLAEGQVEPGSCERLNGVDGVLGAGALKARPVVTLSAAERNPIPSYLVTPGLRRVLGIPDAVGAGVWIPRPLADALGVAQGGVLPTRDGPLEIGAVYDYPEDGRDVRLAWAVLVPAATTESFDQCWVDVWPSNPEVDELLRATTQASMANSKPVSVGLLNNNHGTSFDGAALLAQRPTRHVAVGSALVALAIGALAARRRRLEYASALHAGQRRLDQLAQAGLECAAWGLLAAVFATAGIVLVADQLAPAEPLVVAGGALAVAWLMPGAALLGTLLGVAGTRESHLFRYFKDR